ncbi:unnamed protein product [Callosobruchus maculatus]|uniref:Uncharacterized protein n=1 Tax=Callosobruchus maculatus TaxID=64391 RepID=A0A653DMY6_CALMS|nr:unnamed protein product [Callosobruchus maculatus]
MTKTRDKVHLSVSELRDMACRQQAQIEQQHRLLAAKEQRLRYLKEQEARQRRVHAEGERLRRLRERVDAQELKLRKLRALRGQVDHQKQNNISLTSDLDSIRALFNEKEKELSLAVAKYRNKLNEQQNQRLYQQREALTARQEEMSAIDKRISELQERLHRKRLLNQQLASQISAASHKAAYHQLVRLTGNAEQNNQAFARKQQQNNQSNGLSRGNIAAVEPYNHTNRIRMATMKTKTLRRRWRTFMCLERMKMMPSRISPFQKMTPSTKPYLIIRNLLLIFNVTTTMCPKKI